MANLLNRWTALEHQVFKLFQDENWQGKSLLIAVSGGADSIALLQVMKRISSALKLEISIAHIHHGPGSTEQVKYRDQAQDFVQETARQMDLRFFTSRSEKLLSSEAEMRDFRKSEIERFRKENAIEFSVLAHHQDDYLETQVMRLIRGTGEKGLTPMSILKENQLRPFLKSSKSDILNYLAHQNFQYQEDPSNQNADYFRNWIRNFWLPQLESKCPGALNSLTRSLALLAEPNSLELPEEIWLSNGLSRPVFLTLSHTQKKQVLAAYLRRIGQVQFTQNQLLEVMKRLDNRQLVHSFECMKLVWSLSKDVISATPPFVVNENR
jgi:tRNA(Ile)-lysidine synthase